MVRIKLDLKKIKEYFLGEKKSILVILDYDR